MLIKARKDACITQSDLAKTLDKPQSYISKYERGERRLDIVEFLHIARALTIDPHFIVTEINNLQKSDGS